MGGGMEMAGLFGTTLDGCWEGVVDPDCGGPIIAENPQKMGKMMMAEAEDEAAKLVYRSQNHQRMIKNRESAARSREKKQAYNMELQSMIKQLNDENTRMKRQQTESNKMRLKQLMETLIPVEEMRRPPQRIRKTQSM